MGQPPAGRCAILRATLRRPRRSSGGNGRTTLTSPVLQRRATMAESDLYRKGIALRSELMGEASPPV